jgi:threonylcarbamoyladenosine tRNA methylthiotransferase MtaB
LVDLIRLILKETDFPRIRLSSINPQDITDELIGLWANEERLCRHFHLSLQSGSDTVLKRMGRPYSVHKYYSVVKNITQKIKDVAITTDIIVGFPGETEGEFQETCAFVKRLVLVRFTYFLTQKGKELKLPQCPIKSIRKQKNKEPKPFVKLEITYAALP